MKVALYAAAAILAVFVLVAAASYSRGYSKGWAAHSQLAETQAKALQRANEEAIEEARTAFAREIEAYRIDSERLEDELDKLVAEADSDPAADMCGISADSVRRINSIR